MRLSHAHTMFCRNAVFFHHQQLMTDGSAPEGHLCPWDGKKKNLSHNEKWQSKAGVSNASTLPTLLPLGHMGPSKKGGQELS